MKYSDLSSKNLLVEQQGRVITISLHRPDRLNAISKSLQDEMISLLETTEKDNDVGVAIITGAPRADGRPCFSAGADIKEMQELGGGYAQLALGSLEEGLLKTISGVGESVDKWHSFWSRVQQFPKPLIAAIDGICTAGGLELALCCDIRLVSETAEIRDLHMKNLGILGGGGLQTNLPRAIGLAKAKQLIWTGDTIDGKEAYRIGFAQEVFAPQKLMTEAIQLAGKIAAMSPKALVVSKMVLNASINQGIYESLRFSAMGECLLRFMKSDEQAKARQAFVEKNKQ